MCNSETRLRRAKRIAGIVTISPVRSQKGLISQLVATARDITERQRASAAANRLAAIVEQSQDAIVSFGDDEKIRSWNPGATQLSGYSEEEAAGQTAALVLGEREGDKNLDAISVCAQWEYPELRCSIANEERTACSMFP